MLRMIKESPLYANQTRKMMNSPSIAIQIFRKRIEKEMRHYCVLKTSNFPYLLLVSDAYLKIMSLKNPSHFKEPSPHKYIQ